MWMISGGSIPGQGSCQAFIDEYDPVFIMTYCISAASATLGQSLGQTEKPLLLPMCRETCKPNYMSRYDEVLKDRPVQNYTTRVILERLRFIDISTGLEVNFSTFFKGIGLHLLAGP